MYHYLYYTAMQYKKNETFQDPNIDFDNGVAAIDIITLEAAGLAVEPYTPHQVVRLPITETVESTVFSDLMQITVDPARPSVTAVIDTKKMTWNEIHKPEKSVLTDYQGVSKRAVGFSNVAVATVDEVLVSSIAVNLFNGSTAIMWFAEFTIEALQSKKLYEAYNLAMVLSERFLQNSPERYDKVLVPAQQINYGRSMQEILHLNIGELEDIRQKFKIGLDESGARVNVETTMLAARSIPKEEPEPKIAVFGQRGPVMFWLTEQGEGAKTPFAVVITANEAWLDPSQEVDFSLGPQGD